MNRIKNSKIVELQELVDAGKALAKQVLADVREKEREIEKIQGECKHRLGPPYHTPASFHEDPVDGDVWRDCDECGHVHLCYHFNGRCACSKEGAF